MTFDLSKLRNTPNASDIFRFSRDILAKKTLLNHQVFLLGKSLDSIQDKSIFDRFHEFIYSFNPEMREEYLAHQVKNYTEYLTAHESIFSQEEQYHKQQSALANFKTSLNITFADEDKEKRIFLNEQMKETNISAILENQDLPIIQVLVQQLKDTYDEWTNDTSDSDKKNLKENIETQHANLEMISSIVYELRSEDKKFLKELTKEIREVDKSNTEKVEEKFTALVLGIEERDRALRELTFTGLLDGIQENQSLSEYLKNYLDEKEKPLKTNEDLKAITEELKVKRSESGVSKELIHKTAVLQKTIRVVKAIVSSKMPEELIDQKKSANIVIAFQNPPNPKKLDEYANDIDLGEYGKTIAYYKEGKGNEQAAGDMEKIMWEIAGIFGLEDSFAETEKVSLRTKKEPGKSGESELTWTDKGELVLKNDLPKKHKGGFQVALEGTLLRDVMNATGEKPAIKQEQLIKGTLTTLLFGMFDAHSKNIIVDKENNIKFFDNTRSLPTSNDAILRGDNLEIPYRSALLELDGSRVDLTPQERESIKKEIARFQSKMREIKDFLKRPHIKKVLQKLPPGWWSTEDSLNAMQERLDNMQKAIDNPNVKNLTDFVFAVNPSFKFVAALQLFQNAIQDNKKMTFDELQKECMERVGSNSIDSLIKFSAQNGVNPKEVLEWCTDLSLSFQQVVEKTLEKSKLRRQTKTSQETVHLFNSEEDVKKLFKKKSKIDFKDTKRREAVFDVYNNAYNSLTNADIYISKEEPKPNNVLFNHHRIIFHEIPQEGENISKLVIFYLDKGSVKSAPVDYLEKPGFFKIEDKFYPASEIIKNFGPQPTK